MNILPQNLFGEAVCRAVPLLNGFDVPVDNVTAPNNIIAQSVSEAAITGPRRNIIKHKISRLAYKSFPIFQKGKRGETRKRERWTQII